MSAAQPLGATDTQDYKDNEYVSRQGQQPIQVQSDDAKIEDPIDGEQADTDAQLERDDNEAISQENVISSRTRGGTKPGELREPSDAEVLPVDGSDDLQK